MIRLRDMAFLEDFCHIIVLRDWSLFMRREWHRRENGWEIKFWVNKRLGK